MTALPLPDTRPHAAPDEPPLALYLHWPFCVSKCPYCDFNSHVAEEIDQEAWCRAYLTELETVAALVPDRRLVSIFFGGGTPSLMAPETVATTVERARALWRPNDGSALEVTLEANPNSSEAEKFAHFRSAGVNRLSLGVQALDDGALAFLGRAHSAGEGLRAIELAQRHFPRVNADMIYARPGQTVAAWRTELGRLLDFGLGHLSLYQLTIERGTPFFAAHRRGDFALPGEDTEAALFEATGALLEEAGLSAYEISNYARPGEECRHNLNYWGYGDFLGVGPGAHGRLTLPEGAVATENLRAPADWLAAVESTGRGIKAETHLGPTTRAEEMVMMGLRLVSGILAEDFHRVTGLDFEDVLDARARARLVAAGFLSAETDRLRATASGRIRLNAVLAALLGGAGDD